MLGITLTAWRIFLFRKEAAVAKMAFTNIESNPKVAIKLGAVSRTAWWGVRR